MPETLAGFRKNSVPRVGAARPFTPPRFGRAASFLCASMARGRLPFRETDVFRAVRAIAKAIGQLPAGVRFARDGEFTVFIGKAGEQESAQINDNEVEAWIAKHHVHQS
jgi:hypothetical protein